MQPCGGFDHLSGKIHLQYHDQMLHFMSGKEIFDRYQLAALKNGLGSHEFNYGNILYQALRIEGEEKVFQLLEVAENTGKRIALACSIPNAESGSEPNMVILV